VTAVGGGCPESGTTSCLTDDLVDVSGAAVCVIGTGDCGTVVNQVTGVTGATDIPGLINLVATKDGWVTQLEDTGERLVSRPTVAGGIVFFPTLTPEQDVCSRTGTGKLYALHYLTGGPNATDVIGIDDTQGDEEYVKNSIDLGQGLASSAAVHVGKGGRNKQVNLVLQTDGSELRSIRVTTNEIRMSRWLTWYDNRE